MPFLRRTQSSVAEKGEADESGHCRSRGGYCPKDLRQAEGLVHLYREMEVGYARLVTISTDGRFKKIEDSGEASQLGSSQTVGTVPPSITYSAPVIDAARGDARKATRSATSRGRAGRPIGIPPSDAMRILRAPS
jgi:hypothetical protein